jgi:hypothetical protein
VTGYSISIEQPTKYVLGINLNTTKALGLTIPQSALLRADEVNGTRCGFGHCLSGLFNSTEKRLARVLLHMAEFGESSEPQALLPVITQETLAEMIGTTRSRVSGFMNRFRKLGFIGYNGRIQVNKSLLNVVLHDQRFEHNALLALITAARVARAARDGSVPRPAAVCVMSPWIDLALTSDSIAARAKHDPLLTRDALEDARRLYLGQANAKDPRAYPLYGDLTDLPPVLLHVGADEILLDDARRYAHLLANSGPAAELHVWEGMVHVFPANLVLLQAAREALDLAGEFLRRKRSLAE